MFSSRVSVSEYCSLDKVRFYNSVEQKISTFFWIKKIALIFNYKENSICDCIEIELTRYVSLI